MALNPYYILTEWNTCIRTFSRILKKKYFEEYFEIFWKKYFEEYSDSLKSPEFIGYQIGCCIGSVFKKIAKNHRETASKLFYCFFHFASSSLTHHSPHTPTLTPSPLHFNSYWLCQFLQCSWIFSPLPPNIQYTRFEHFLPRFPLVVHSSGLNLIVTC